MPRALCSISIVAILAFITGCSVNPYMKFYDGLTADQVLANDRNIITNGPPKIIRGSNAEKDMEDLISNGFNLIGYSGFEAAEIKDNKAVEYGSSIHASVVVLYKQYENTLTSNLPFTLGGKTTYIPTSTNRYSYYAAYFVKAKPPIFGALLSDLNAEQKQSLGSNKGVIITTIIKNSPAYANDFLVGDILRKINNQEIYDKQDFSKYLVRYAGTEVTIEMYRNNDTIVKTIKLDR